MPRNQVVTVSLPFLLFNMEIKWLLYLNHYVVFNMELKLAIKYIILMG